MKEKKKRNDTDEQDLQDFFMAMNAGDEMFLWAILLSTPSHALRRRISIELTPKEKYGCQADVIQLSY